MLSLPIFGMYDLLVFVLIFSLVYAVLSRSKFFSKSDIPALIAVSVAIVSLGSAFFVSFIIAFLPYVLAILVFLFLIMLLFNMATVPQEAVGSYLKKSTLIPVLIIFMMFIFGLIAYGTAASQNAGSYTAPTACVGACSGSNATSSGSGTSSGSSGTVIRTSFSDETSTYIISILTAPSVLSLLLTLFAMAMAVYFMTRQRGA